MVESRGLSRKIPIFSVILEKVKLLLIPWSTAICLETRRDVGKLKIRKITSRWLFSGFSHQTAAHLNKPRYHIFSQRGDQSWWLGAIPSMVKERADYWENCIGSNTDWNFLIFHSQMFFHLHSFLLKYISDIQVPVYIYIYIFMLGGLMFRWIYANPPLHAKRYASLVRLYTMLHQQHHNHACGMKTTLLPV